MFGLNAGTQCVAMSLAFLTYIKENGIISTMDLVNIMNIGNELYSGLSSLSRQSYLLLIEVSEMIIVFNINYQLQKQTLVLLLILLKQFKLLSVKTMKWE